MPSRPRALGPQESEHLAEMVREHREALGLDFPGLAARMSAHRCDRHPDGCAMSATVLRDIEKGIAVPGDRRHDKTSYRSRLISVDELVAFIHVLRLDWKEVSGWLFG